MANTYSNLNDHAVFSTKGRLPLIHPDLESELYRYAAGIVKGEKAILLCIGGTNNHVHMVLRFKPRHVIPQMMKKIKAKATKWVNDHRKIDGRFAWQTGYGIFTVSESQLPAVMQYVSNQKKHHQTRSFEDEYQQLLCKHSIDYDPRYLWG